MGNEQPIPLEIDVHETWNLLKSGSPPLLLDCREPFEVATVCLDVAVTIPMHQIPERAQELEAFRDQHIVVYCHHGMRSQRVAIWLRGQGFVAQSMRGGIDAWAATIDPDMIRY